MKKIYTFLLIFVMAGLTGCQSHTHSYTEKIIEPTCTEYGYTLFECACGDSYTNNYINPLGHNETDWIIETNATCTEDGLKYKKCTVCGTKTSTQSISKAHSYDSNNKCIVCGKINPKYPYIEIPQVPIQLSYYNYSGKKQTSCTINKIEKNDYSSKTEIKFTVTKTYDISGSSNSSACKFGYKLYDSTDTVVMSGTIYSPAISVGETAEKTLSLYYNLSNGIECGQEYKLELLSLY